MAGLGDLEKALESIHGGKIRVHSEKKVGDKVETATIQVATLIKDVFTAIRNTTHGKEVVSLPSFGNFRVMDRKATKARNPQTGAQFDVAASKRMKFTASKTLRAFLNGVTLPTETK